MARAIWSNIICFDSIRRAMHLDWDGWIAANAFFRKDCFHGLRWHVIFIFSCWYIWKWRCKLIFDNEFHLAVNPVRIILETTKEWCSAGILSGLSVPRTNVALRWSKPPIDWFKLNVDGARNGAGGVIRDSSCSWCAGFAANKGKGSVLEAELWGLLLGLKLAAANHYEHLIVECDSAVLVEMTNMGLNELQPLKTMFESCKVLQNGFSTCDIRHAYREINMVADILSKCRLTSELGVVYFSQPPPHVSNALLDDLCDTIRFREVAMAT